MDIAGFSKELALTPLSLTIQTQGWVIPTVQSIHILGIAAVMASSAMLNLRLAGLIGRSQSIEQVCRRFLPVIWWTLPIMLVTGLILVVGEPARELLSPFFWTKMLLLVVAILLTLPIRSLAEDKALRDHSPSRRSTIRLIALLSLTAWVIIVFCGRWIAYA